ncbi:MAG: hypothetical protein RL329_4150 [Bacteroidota bacterium]|jgi:hypothetical protein
MDPLSPVKDFLDYRFIYILGSTHYWFRYKIGIAKDLQVRQRGISSTIRGEVYEIWALKVCFARKIEGTFHLIYSPFHAKMRGSGKTEWFWMVFPITPILLLTAVWVIQWCIIPMLLVAAYHNYLR